MEYDIESILEKYEDDYNPGPRPMAQEPRNMYNQGQLVSNTVDGSRPGYSGKNAMSGSPAQQLGNLKKTPVAKNIIDIQSESGTLLQQPKYKANLRKALDQVSALQEKLKK